MNIRHGLNVTPMYGMSNCQSWFITTTAISGNSKHEIPYIIADCIIALARCLLSWNSDRYAYTVAADPEMLKKIKMKENFNEISLINRFAFVSILFYEMCYGYQLSDVIIKRDWGHKNGTLSERMFLILAKMLTACDAHITEHRFWSLISGLCFVIYAVRPFNTFASMAWCIEPFDYSNF